MVAGSRDLDEVRRIVLDGLRGQPVRVYLFGSWAKGGGSRISDIDVAVEALEPLPPGLLAEIHEALEESRVLLPVDLVDLSRATPEFSRIVRSEGIPWTG
jgi:predicted nucleotidyltransferase